MKYLIEGITTALLVIVSFIAFVIATYFTLGLFMFLVFWSLASWINFAILVLSIGIFCGLIAWWGDRDSREPDIEWPPAFNSKDT